MVSKAISEKRSSAAEEALREQRTLSGKVHFRSLDSGISGQGLRAQGSGFGVQSSGLRVQGSGFRVQGSGLRVEVWELRVARITRRQLVDECTAQRASLGTVVADPPATLEATHGQIFSQSPINATSGRWHLNWS